MSLKIYCPLCETDATEFQSLYTHKSEVFKQMTRQKCLSCDFQFADPMPNENLLNKYNNSFHDSAYGGHERSRKVNAFFTGISKTRIHFIQNHLKFNSKNKIRLLEIGPGPGAFASIWINLFPNTKYFGIETDVSCHKELKDLGVNLIDNNEILKYNDYFDLVVISHVLEHVTDPIHFLTRYIKTIKKNSCLYIEVPCSDWSHMKKMEPHLLFFDKKSMLVLINKLKLTLVKIAYFGIPLEQIKNPIFKFLKRIRAFFFHKTDLRYFHHKRKGLKKVIKNKLEVEALLNIDAHLEHDNPSWWLRVIVKK